MNTTYAGVAMRRASPDEKWLAEQVERIDPNHDEQGNEGGYTRALEYLAIEMKLDRDHWKNNHDAQVGRARVLIERTDVPIERVRAYKQMEILTAERDTFQVEANDWRMRFEMCNAALKVFTAPDQKPFAYFHHNTAKNLWEQVIVGAAGHKGIVAAYAAPQAQPVEPYAWFWKHGSENGVLTVRQDFEQHQRDYPGMTFTPVFTHSNPLPSGEREVKL